MDENKSPILNNPYEEPQWHYDATLDGNLDYTKVGSEVNLIIEISGFSNDRFGNKELKRFYTQNYWIPAANNLKDYGRWDFIEITDIDNIKALLIQKIQTL